MNRFYCNVCKKDIMLENGICPDCKTNWDKIINESQISSKNNTFDNCRDINSITEEHINDNINFYLTWSKIIKIFY